MIVSLPFPTCGDSHKNYVTNSHNIYVTTRLTFPELHQALAAVKKLCQRWKDMIQSYGMGLSVGINKGDVLILRSYVYGNDIHTTVGLTDLSRMILSSSECSVIASQRIRSEARVTIWEPNFRELDSNPITDEPYRTLVEEHGAYQFVVSDQ